MRKGRARVHLSTRIERGLPQPPQRRWLEKAVRAALKSGKVELVVGLTVVITSDASICELNRLYRGIDAPTDVLSFGNAAGEAQLPGADDAYLGDVVISYARASEQAAAFGHSVEEETALLVIHGVLHLLGYDHEQADDRLRMWSAQDQALEMLGIQWRA